MITQKDVQKLLDKGVEFKKECIALIAEILKQAGALDKEHTFKFSVESYQAPQFNSTNCPFDTGLDVYISELWLDDQGDIRANYVSDEDDSTEENMLLSDEQNVDYADILSWMRNEL